MSKELKLICPMCEKEFITNHRSKLWCSPSCMDKMARIKKRIKNVYDKQERFLTMKDYMCYDLETDKFYLKSMMPNK